MKYKRSDIMKIEVWSDFACPFCYIGKTRFDNALKRFPHKDNVKVIYKAYQLNPFAPKVMEGSAAEAFAKGHGTTKEKAIQKFEMFVTNAKSVGLEYNYDAIQLTNTFDAHRLAKWASTFGKEEELTSRLMKAYFTDGMNLANTSDLLQLIIELGFDSVKAKDILDSDQYADQVKAEIEEAKQVGVQGVPFFVLNRKYGVSGAQQEEYFYNVLQQLWEEEKPLETIRGASKTESCDDESCSI